MPRTIVVAYGDPALLDRCLTTLSMGSDAIVVDNGGGAADTASRHGARYVRPRRNLGYAAAVNVGLREAEGHDVLLLNPDAELSADALGRLQSALRADERTAAVAPRIETEPTTWPIPTPRGAWAEALGIHSRHAEFLGGAVLLLRAEALADVGEFDERFFLYAEESDWQLRALRRGWLVRSVPEVTATHVGGGTSSDPGRRQRLFVAGTENFVRKWYGGRGWLVYRAGAFVTAVRRLAVGSGAYRDRLRLIALLLRGPLRAAQADLRDLRA